MSADGKNNILDQDLGKVHVGKHTKEEVMPPLNSGNGKEEGSGHLKRVAFLKSLFGAYASLLNPKAGDTKIPFWDLVVLSAGNDDQKHWFEVQLNEKIESGSVPKGVEFKVFADPGGIRSGDGAATMNIISKLQSYLGDRLYKMKVLLIHAGGFSKRLPTCCVTSKIFSPLPVDWESPEGQTFQVLDMKLLNYLPIMNMIPPGLFMTSSDEFISYYLDEEDIVDIKSELENMSKELPVLISLGHPRPFELGQAHGVFQLRPNDVKRITDTSACLMTKVRSFLQKPSFEMMRQKEGMILENEEHGKFIMSDSFNWMSPELMRRMSNFYKEVQPITEEISIFNEFIPCQGTSSNDSKEASKTENVTKKKIFDFMKDVPLYCLAMNQSRFYHIGTLNEYLDGFCSQTQLRQAMNFTRCVGLDNSDIKGVIVRSSVPEGMVIPERVILEHVVIENKEVTFGKNTILSNCHLDKDFNQAIPSNHVFHTLPVRTVTDGVLKFVTTAFDISASFKSKSQSISELYYGSRLLQDYFAKPINTGDIFNNKTEPDLGLWKARIFPLAPTMSASFALTLSVIKGEVKMEKDWERLSMDDLIQKKDMAEILRFRNAI